MKLLIANRGEIAVRIMRAAAELNIPTVAVFPEDDANALHTKRADESVALKGVGAMAYLDLEQIIEVAKASNCDAVHPGYGFLSENAGFARRCEEEGIVFIGPRPETLEEFGNKARARTLAEDCGVPLVNGSSGPVTLDQARAFLDSLGDGGAIMVKALSGGGGRGMRQVFGSDELEEAYTRCQSEARQAFGNDELYVERLILRARHIEVQIIGDGSGSVSHLGERECSLQRQHQKLIEMAPSPAISQDLRDRLTGDAVRMAKAVNYRNAGTFEFMVDLDAGDDTSSYAFIEANARLQVEHTVTEEVMDLDLVKIQLQIAGGSSLADLGLEQGGIPEPRGYAIQARVNMETMDPDGVALPAGGILSVFEVPSGRGLRVDTFGYAGYRTSPHYDSLLAKCIAHTNSSNFADAVARIYRALCEFKIEGVSTNIPFLQSLVQHPDFAANRTYTGFVGDHIQTLVATDNTLHRRLFFDQSATPAIPAAPGTPVLAGAKVDEVDPLAVIAHGKQDGPASIRADVVETAQPAPAYDMAGMEGTLAVEAHIQGTIVSLDVNEGDVVTQGREILVMNAMKMEHVIRAPVDGLIRKLTIAVGDTVYEGHPLVFIEEREIEGAETGDADRIDLDYVRPDLAEVHERHRITLDEARPDAVAKRRKTKQRTARENIDDLCDPGTFMEHGQLVLTPGTGLSEEEVIRKFSTDGMVTGIGSVNGELFPGETSRCVVMSYDYTVLAGTQGAINHPKTDRMLELAAKWRRPVVFFTEGGGGRAGTGGKREGGESTTTVGQGRLPGTYRPLDTPTFATMGRLSGLVPLVGITSRFCFAGNASLLGCCDVIIATRNANIGMGGPALIEGGGLGVFRPDEIGPLEVQVPSGVVDVAVEDEAEAVAVAKQYLSYFQGPVDQWDCMDQRHLRNIVPENRLRIYNIRDVIETMADTGSVLELRPKFGLGMVTAFIRIEGRPIGVLANNPTYLSGAIDSDGSDKAARFLQLCDAFDVPILVLCDTPGMMVGPEVERTGLVRHCSRLFVTGANLTVPHLTIVLRKAYGLGAQAMAGGSLKEPYATVSWPTGEFGGMGLEGQVKLGFRNELAAIEDPKERAQRYEELVEFAYLRGRAINSGVSFAVDDVIDPADSRRWISNVFESVPPTPAREGKKRRNIDAW
ncbi:MAG: carbamoyl-phosphate synthase large subunit [Proteobacteria bacterium]|nr:carbamoyl-phosphate synthase large subunit [Pseudomonadota bacterium]